jgi:hypothetical protein
VTAITAILFPKADVACVGDFEMRKDEREVLEVLKSELEYVRNGTYSEHESWGPRFIFEDSPTCQNFGHRDNPSPCSGCILMDFVPPEHHSQKFPCRHIPLDALGQTLDSLYRHGDEGEVEQVVCNWLQATIQRLEQERESYRQQDERTSLSSPWQRSAGSGQHATRIALYEKVHPKCANPACPAAFHWLAGGKLFRFRPDEGAYSNDPQPMAGTPTERQGVKHYWLCERCSHQFTLIHEQQEGVVLKLQCLGLPMVRAAAERE